MNRSLLSLAVLPLLATSTTAGTEYEITIVGYVEYNGISAGVLGGAVPNSSATLSFRVDSDVFLDSPNFPTRGYSIIDPTFEFELASGTLSLQSPYSGFDAMFVLRNNDPAVDGFLISDNVDSPEGCPLSQNGVFGPFTLSWYATYGASLLPSLDIADAVGTYDFTGLTVFNYTVDDGPANPMGLVFDSFTIAEVVAGSATVYGCGVNPAGSMTVIAANPKVGGLVRLGITNPVGTQDAGSLSALFVGFGAPGTYPCGLSLPGFGMAGAGANGEILLDPAAPWFLLNGPAWGGTGTFAPFLIGIPNDTALAGKRFYAQGMLVDPVAASGVTIGLTDAVDVLIGG